MAEETTEEKRPAVKARKAEAQLAQKTAKGARRKQCSGNGPRKADTAYGTRAVRKQHHGPAISITVQLPLGLRRPAVSKKGGSPSRSKAKKIDGKHVQSNPGRSGAYGAFRRRLWPVLAVPVIAVAGAAIYLVPFQGDAEKPVQTAEAAARTVPDYRPLLPSAEKATASTYDGKRNLVSYNVTFSGARLTVSQQPLPENFTKDPAAIMKAADSIKASEQIETDKGLLYIATNDEAGDQLALIADKSVQLFIHANQKIDTATWQSFINLLEAKSWEGTKS